MRYNLIMIDKATCEKISEFARECTIGCGNVGHEACTPTRIMLDSFLHRAASREEWTFFRNEWDACLAQAEQP